MADAIEFLESTQNLSSNSKGTTKLIRTNDQLFNTLNARSPIGNGFKKPLKVIPQFCIAHFFCAYFNNKSLRNIFKMAAILLQKNKSKRARNGRFSGLKRVSKKKNDV